MLYEFSGARSYTPPFIIVGTSLVEFWGKSPSPPTCMFITTVWSLCPLLHWVAALSFKGDVDWPRVSGSSYAGAVLGHRVAVIGQQGTADLSGDHTNLLRVCACPAGLGRCTQTSLIYQQGVWLCFLMTNLNFGTHFPMWEVLIYI